MRRIRTGTVFVAQVVHKSIQFNDDSYSTNVSYHLIIIITIITFFHHLLRY